MYLLWLIVRYMIYCLYVFNKFLILNCCIVENNLFNSTLLNCFRQTKNYSRRIWLPPPGSIQIPKAFQKGLAFSKIKKDNIHVCILSLSITLFNRARIAAVYAHKTLQKYVKLIITSNPVSFKN